jgi:hypothetical protein
LESPRITHSVDKFEVRELHDGAKDIQALGCAASQTGAKKSGKVAP